LSIGVLLDSGRPKRAGWEEPPCLSLWYTGKRVIADVAEGRLNHGAKIAPWHLDGKVETNDNQFGKSINHD
jgi:hypothetical protein